MAQTHAEPLKPDPFDYVARAGRGASVVPAGAIVLGGRRMACGRAPTVLDPHLEDYAASSESFVILNLPLMERIATPVRLWIYSHECGHVFGIRDEAEADCFGIRQGRRQGWLTPDAFNQICAFISAGQADAKHFAGPARCALMRQCYKQLDVEALRARSR